MWVGGKMNRLKHKNHKINKYVTSKKKTAVLQQFRCFRIIPWQMRSRHFFFIYVLTIWLNTNTTVLNLAASCCSTLFVS